MALLAASLLAAASAGAPAPQAGAQPGTAAAAPGTGQSARWAQRKINFTYLGFTTHYSCEGLTDKVKQILLELGARRSDLHVHEAQCTARVGAPTPFPAVAGTFSVLEPVSEADESGAVGSSGVVAAHWQTVNVRVGSTELDMDGQCELLEQVKSRILPLIPTRNLQYRSTCVPHELTPGGTSLRVQVLVPDVNSSPTG